jgi:hypothetical protein
MVHQNAFLGPGALAWRMGRALVACATATVVLAHATELGGQGQSAPPGPLAATHVEIAGRVITVSYDLPSPSPTAMFTVSLEASLDAGATFSVKPVSVSGDVGPNVKAGPGKRIVWQTTDDVQVLQLERFTFRIVAVPTSTTNNAASTAAVREPHSNVLKWLIAGLAAAGTAAVFVLRGSGNANTDTNCNATFVQPATPIPVPQSGGQITVQVSEVVIDPDGTILSSTCQVAPWSSSPALGQLLSVSPSASSASSTSVTITVGANPSGQPEPNMLIACFFVASQPVPAPAYSGDCAFIDQPGLSRAEQRARQP